MDIGTKHWRGLQSVAMNTHGKQTHMSLDTSFCMERLLVIGAPPMLGLLRAAGKDNQSTIQAKQPLLTKRMELLMVEAGRLLWSDVFSLGALLFLPFSVSVLPGLRIVRGVLKYRRSICCCDLSLVDIE